MWIEVENTRSFQRRAKIAQISRTDWINLGHSKETLHLLVDDSLSEDFIRNVLSNVYGNIDKWLLIVVSYNIHYDCYDILVESPDFETVIEGAEFSRLERNNHETNHSW